MESKTHCEHCGGKLRQVGTYGTLVHWACSVCGWSTFRTVEPFCTNV